MLKKTLIYSLPVIIGTLVVIAIVLAWTEPLTAPPGGNVPAPLNVSGLGQEKTGGLILNTGGAANGLIIDKGNVGIGTTAPGAKLEVAGQIKITGGAPGAGKVLTSDASGLATWEDVTNIRFNADSTWRSNVYTRTSGQPEIRERVDLGSYSFCALGKVSYDHTEEDPGGGWCDVYYDQTTRTWKLYWGKRLRAGISCAVNCF